MPYLLILTQLIFVFSCHPKTETVEEVTLEPKKPRTIVTTDGEIDECIPKSGYSSMLLSRIINPSFKI